MEPDLHRQSERRHSLYPYPITISFPLGFPQPELQIRRGYWERPRDRLRVPWPEGPSWEAGAARTPTSAVSAAVHGRLRTSPRWAIYQVDVVPSVLLVLFQDLQRNRKHLVHLSSD